MTRAPTRSPAPLAAGAFRTLAAAGCAALSLLAASPALAVDWSGGGGGGGGFGAGAPAGAAHPGMLSQRIALSIGKSVIVDLPRDAKEVFVANPAVANAVVRSTRKIFLIGQANGATSIFVFDAEGRQIASLDVTVGRDLGSLRETLRRSIPNAAVEVQPAGDSILLTGSVATAADAQRAVDIANAFVGAAADARGAVINSLVIGSKDQVMLRVTVVEVDRSVLKEFGITTNAGWSPVPRNIARGVSLNSTNGRVTAGISGGGFTLESTLTAFERAGLSRVLAEPTLVAVSGETADFQAGGEIPIQNCSGSAAERSCGINLLPFGVTLSFTPVVLSENRISLRVATRVREIDNENALTIEGTRYPGFSTRESTTTVEIPSGSTIMTAGLLRQVSSNTISGMPGLMSLPILGALFRSQSYLRDETELMILVTPLMAQSMQPSQVARPDDGFVDAYDPQRVLLGRLNQIYGSGGAGDPIGLRGVFGFIAD